MQRENIRLMAEKTVVSLRCGVKCPVWRQYASGAGSERSAFGKYNTDDAINANIRYHSDAVQQRDYCFVPLLRLSVTVQAGT